MAIRILLCVYSVSLLTALALRLLGLSYEAFIVGLPALALSGLALYGHLVTLDDDMPGEWSNPMKDKEIWRQSLLELGLKAIAFATVAIAILV